MNWAWASSLDEIWRSSAFPMWMTLAAAGFFGFILLVTLLRAERSLANGALTVITLLAIAIAVAATVRAYGPAGQATPAEARAQAGFIASLPALSCLDDLAGDAVAVGCEKALFGSPDAVAAAVSYTAVRIDRLTALGDAATVDKSLTLDMKVTGTRSLRLRRTGADRPRRLHPVRLRRLPLADRSAAGRRQHGFPSLRHAGRTLCAGLERARNGPGDAGHRGACRDAAIDADGQADQCGVPERVIDAAGEHHESGAAHGGGATGGACRRRSRGAARVRSDLGAGRCSSGAGCEEAASAEGRACAGRSTGSARAAGPSRGSCGCG